MTAEEVPEEEERSTEPMKASDYLIDITDVPLAQCFVDHSYQRGVRKTRVKKLVDGWSWRRYSPILVASRRDRYAVIDGQQRFMAAQELGLSTLPAIILVARDRDDEAEQFVGANDGSPVGAGDRFRASVIYHDEKSLDIVRIVKEQGFSLACMAGAGNSNLKDPYAISAVFAVENIYAQGYLDRVLNCIAQSWGRAPVRTMVNTEVLRGVYLALRHLDRFEVPMEALVASLIKLDVGELLDKGLLRYKSMQSSRSVPGGIAAVIIEQFNYRKPAARTVPPYDRSAARAMRGNVEHLGPQGASRGGRASAASNPRTNGRFTKRAS